VTSPPQKLDPFLRQARVARRVGPGASSVGLGVLMRFAIYGLLFAALVLLISGGHLLFLSLFFLLPLGGMFGHHQRHGHFWYRERRR
jgi:hypothetical protein